jgi:glutathione S-transferase
MIEMWELRGEDDRRFSTFSWRTRMALRHKSLEVEYRPILLTDKAAIAFSGGKTVPVIRDGETVVRDSWSIAEYLEDTYPDQPTLFGGDAGRALSRLVNNWVDRTLLAIAFPLIAADAMAIQCAEDRDYFGKLIERLTGAPPAALAAQQPRNAERLARAMDPARATLKRQVFLGGAGPGYADYAVFSIYQWARIVSPLDLLADDPVLRAWFDRLLDLNDGYARSAPALRG